MNVRVMTLALAAMLAIPAALAAGWAGKGQYEPDTSFDTPSYMWANPDVSAQPTTGGGLNAVSSASGANCVPGARSGPPPETSETGIRRIGASC